MFYDDQLNPWMVDEETASRCLQPMLVLLRATAAGRLRVNRSCALTTESGRLLGAAIDPEHRWLVTYTSSAHEHPLAALLETALRLRLVRVRPRDLRLRNRGAKAMIDVRALWQNLVARIPFEEDPFGRDAARFLLVLTAGGAFGSFEQALRTVDRLILAAGWQFEGGTDFGIGAVHAARMTLATLQFAANLDVTERDDDGTPPQPFSTRGALLLASATLANETLFDRCADRPAGRPPANTR